MPTLPIADKATLDAVLAYVDELEARLTAVRAGKIDNLDTLISSRAVAVTALSTVQWTNTRAGYLDQIPNVLKKPGSYQTSCTVGAHRTNTILQVTGSGYAVALQQSESDYGSLQIDGGSIYLVEPPIDSGTITLFPLRFNSSFKFSCSSVGTRIAAWVVLD
jgi:hypothetical protein